MATHTIKHINKNEITGFSLVFLDTANTQVVIHGAWLYFLIEFLILQNWFNIFKHKASINTNYGRESTQNLNVKRT